MANGANWKTNFGYASLLEVATSPVNQDQSSIAMLKFDLTQVCKLVDPSNMLSTARIKPWTCLRNSDV